MYGKIFESMYRGSMVGAGSPVFAVWGYVIANMRADKEVGAQVDLNPVYLGMVLGESPEVVVEVIEKLCGPDPRSTSKEEEGRRLIRMGEFSYRVVNGAKYMAIRNEEERREYNRLAKRRQRSNGTEEVLKQEAGLDDAAKRRRAKTLAKIKREEEIQAKVREKFNPGYKEDQPVDHHPPPKETGPKPEWAELVEGEEEPQ